MRRVVFRASCGQIVLGSLSNDDGDVNVTGIKAIGLDPGGVLPRILDRENLQLQYNYNYNFCTPPPGGLDWQNKNFARASRFIVHFFALTVRLRRENA